MGGEIEPAEGKLSAHRRGLGVQRLTRLIKSTSRGCARVL